MPLKVKIVDAPKELAAWFLIGVDDDNWWNGFAPGIDCAKEFAPGPEYDPNKQLNILRTGRQVRDALCSDLVDVRFSSLQGCWGVYHSARSQDRHEGPGHRIFH